MIDQIHAVFGQGVESGSRSGSAGIVVSEQQVLGCTVWAALAPLLEDLGQAVVDIFREEARYHLFCNTLRSLEFHLGRPCTEPIAALFRDRTERSTFRQLQCPRRD